MTGADACPECRRRTWLLGALAGHLDTERGRVEDLLGLADPDLIDAVGGGDRDGLRRRWAAFDPETHVRACARARLTAICACGERYPSRLRDLPTPPRVLHVAGDPAHLGALEDGDPVALVGARRASPYGRESAAGLAAGLAVAGLPVVSGLALGVDAAAHAGALGAGGVTVAVLAAAAERPYPAAHRGLHRRILERGVVLSELAPGLASRRWMFPARNRIIAALAAMTVVVQARERSGALLTASWARRLDRRLGAVPGPIGVPLSVGPHRLIRDGAELVGEPGDVLAALGAPLRSGGRSPAELDPALERLLDILLEGETDGAAFARAGLAPDAGLAALAELELAGVVRRGMGGRILVDRSRHPED